MAKMCLVPTAGIRSLAEKIRQAYPEACKRNGFSDQMCAEWVGLYNDLNNINNPDNIPSMKSLVNAIEKMRNNEGKSFLRNLDEEFMLASRQRYRHIYNSDLKPSVKKSIQKYIESLPEDTDTSRGLYYRRGGYIYKFNTSLYQYYDNRKLKRDGFEILDVYDIRNLNKKDVNNVEYGFKQTKQSDSSIIAQQGLPQRIGNGGIIIIDYGEGEENYDTMDSQPSSSDGGTGNRSSQEDSREIPVSIIEEIADSEETLRALDSKESSDPDLNKKFGDKTETTVSEILDHLLANNTHLRSLHNH